MLPRRAAGAPRCPGRAGWELRLVVQGGLRILDKIEALGFDTLSPAPDVGSRRRAAAGLARAAHAAPVAGA